MLRKLARQVAEGKAYPRRVKSEMLHKTLGPPDYLAMRANDEDQIGVVTGLVWNSSGGDIMTIEVLLLAGQRQSHIDGTTWRSHAGKCSGSNELHAQACRRL